MWRTVFLGLFTLAMMACSFNDYNTTTYAYQFNPALASKPIKQIMILPINFDRPSRHYLQRYESAIDESVKAYLIKAGYKILPDKSFESLWKKAQLEFGSIYNPTTGEMTAGFKPALENTLAMLFRQNPNLDAVLFTDLLETSVQYKNGSKRIAEWHGARRKIKVEGIDDSLTDEFNWSQSVDAISIGIHVFNRDQQLLQHSIGGIQIAQALVMNNKTGRFSRRNDLLVNEDEINEGVALALHPLISMKHYPGNTSE